ncbi:hypothetical protein ACGFWD_40270 [Streptomyces sp. NPDC048448]|uniref:hypothetical protein n=1 Tax=unclassified Streptomyces TaxID=2593676 RepID=UPI002E3567E4|nr:hypothetical protein [Streptomyces sp. NBC_01462]
MAAPTAGHSEQLTTPERQQIFAWSREIDANRRQLEKRWTQQLAASSCVVLPPHGAPAPLEHLAEGGGFRIPASHTDQLGSAAADFFSDMAVRDGCAYLRGFGYYAADAQMYLPGRAPSPARRFSLVAERWPRYAAFARPLADGAAEEPARWYPWLAWLAFLEAAVNDVCTARWSAAALGQEETAAVLDGLLEGLAVLLAEASFNRWHPAAGPCAPHTWGDRAVALLADPHAAEVLHGVGRELACRGAAADAVRAVREGDVLWQVAAVADTRWPAITHSHPQAPVLLVSEAFGAMAAGPLLAGMLPAADRARVRLAVSRFSVHEAEMARVAAGTWRTGPLDADGVVVVHVDDSVFTGRTHDGLRDSLTGTPAAVYLVPLTLDVGTPFNHPEELTALGRDVADHLATLEEQVRQVGGVLPTAPSLWARRKRPGPPGESAVAAFARVSGGSDRLLALLWDRYAPEVRRA